MNNLSQRISNKNYSIINIVVLGAMGTADALVIVEVIIGLSAGLMFSSIDLRLFSAAKCLFTCLVKWSLLMNRRWHMEQTNFFSPVWVLLCRDNSSDRENCRPHDSHKQMNGFSPKIKTNLVIDCIKYWK